MPLSVEIWSDIACPWCWVGKRHLEAALERFPHPVEVTWRAFELDPGAPARRDSDVDYVQRLADKYRTSRAGAQAMIDRMVGVGAERGLDFRFDRAQPGNTFDAHRLLSWTHAHHPEMQDVLKERLFVAYMHEGRSVADHDTLVELAVEVGLDADAVQAVLSTDDHAAQVRAEEALAHQMGVTGVPFFVVGQRYAVPGAQPSELLLEVLHKAWDERAASDDDGTVEDAKAREDAEVCGPDGCAVPTAS